jgi:hypothetical protein
MRPRPISPISVMFLHAGQDPIFYRQVPVRGPVATGEKLTLTSRSDLYFTNRLAAILGIAPGSRATRKLREGKRA